MLRSILAVVLGLVAASVVVFAVQAIGHAIYRPPADLDLNDREAMKAHIEQLPVGAFLIVLASYAAGALVGGWLAARLARRATVVHALVVGAFLLAAGVMNVVMIPHPLWFTIVALAVFLPAAYLGALLTKRPITAQPSPS